MSDDEQVSEPGGPSTALDAATAGPAGPGDAPGPRHSRPDRPGFGDRVRFVLRGLGQTLITLGLVLLLFVVYEVYVSNFFAHREQAKVHRVLQQQWAEGRDLLALPEGELAALTGQGIANLYIPRFGRDFAWTIVEGSTVPDDSQLERGPAHYGGTALPGQIGNFAMAGHRVGKGEPFLNLDHLRAGDAVIVETKTNWYVYRVKGADGDITKADADGIPGREIVQPSDGGPIMPVPDHPGARPTEALLTMTTCHPKFTAEHRMIVYAKLAEALPRTGIEMPAGIRSLYEGD